MNTSPFSAEAILVIAPTPPGERTIEAGGIQHEQAVPNLMLT
jgi:hypothetical protein